MLWKDAMKQPTASKKDTISLLSGSLTSHLSQKNAISCMSCKNESVFITLERLPAPAWCLSGSWEGLQISSLPVEPQNYTWRTGKGVTLLTENSPLLSYRLVWQIPVVCNSSKIFSCICIFIFNKRDDKFMAVAACVTK